MKKKKYWRVKKKNKVKNERNGMRKILIEKKREERMKGE